MRPCGLLVFTSLVCVAACTDAPVTGIPAIDVATLTSRAVGDALTRNPIGPRSPVHELADHDPTPDGVARVRTHLAASIPVTSEPSNDLVLWQEPSTDVKELRLHIRCHPDQHWCVLPEVRAFAREVTEREIAPRGLIIIYDRAEDETQYHNGLGLPCGRWSDLCQRYENPAVQISFGITTR